MHILTEQVSGCLFYLDAEETSEVFRTLKGKAKHRRKCRPALHSAHYEEINIDEDLRFLVILTNILLPVHHDNM